MYFFLILAIHFSMNACKTDVKMFIKTEKGIIIHKDTGFLELQVVNQGIIQIRSAISDG
jgi:hypothetical protein